ncbi:carboxypeptidase regulatory-like domain-containing protein [Candidatus Riflebacteria bacterium]
MRLTILIILFFCCCSSLAAKDGTILGKVRERTTGKELASVLVVAKSATNGREVFSATSSLGDYTFYNISPDTWKMGYTLNGYKTIHPGQSGGPVVYLGHGHTAYVNVYLDPNYSRVYGRVVDATSLFPVVGAKVEINGIGRWTTTDSNGFFSFENVTAGNYTINITHPQHNSITNLAITVLPTSDTNLGDIKFSFSSVTISGRLVPQNPSFLEAVNGYAKMSLSVLNYPTAQVSLAKDRTGVFNISSIPGNNSYRLLPSLPGYYLQSGGTEVVVQAGPFNTNVGDIAMLPYKNQVSGSVRTSDGVVAKTGTVTIVELGMTTSINIDGSYNFYNVQTEHDLSFSFLAFRDPGGANVAEVLNGFKVRPLRTPIPFQVQPVITRANAYIALRDVAALSKVLEQNLYSMSDHQRNALMEQLQWTKKSLFSRILKEPRELKNLKVFWENSFYARTREKLQSFWKKLESLKRYQGLFKRD